VAHPSTTLGTGLSGGFLCCSSVPSQLKSGTPVRFIQSIPLKISQIKVLSRRNWMARGSRANAGLWTKTADESVCRQLQKTLLSNVIPRLDRGIHLCPDLQMDSRSASPLGRGLVGNDIGGKVFVGRRSEPPVYRGRETRHSSLRKLSGFSFDSLRSFHSEHRPTEDKSAGAGSATRYVDAKM